MNIAKEIVDPLGMVVDVVPSSPTTCNEEIRTVEKRNGLRKGSAILIAEVEIAFVVPGVELGRVALLRHGLGVVDQDDRLVALKNAKVLQVSPVVFNSRHGIHGITSQSWKKTTHTDGVARQIRPTRESYMEPTGRPYRLREGGVYRDINAAMAMVVFWDFGIWWLNSKSVAFLLPLIGTGEGDTSF